MKITAKAQAVSFVVTGANDEVLFSHTAENVETSGDLAALLTNFSSLAHLFKQLDATHNVASSAPLHPEVVAGPALPRREYDDLMSAWHALDTAIVEEALDLGSRFETKLAAAREMATHAEPRVGFVHGFDVVLSTLSGTLRTKAYANVRIVEAVEALSHARIAAKYPHQ